MAHHAYLRTGDSEAGIAAALSFGERELGLAPLGNPDVVVYRYGHFPVEDARRIVSAASQAPLKDHRLIVIAAERLFHEAQNALLKVFEEPAPGTTLVLVVPAEGPILPTLRSRLIALPGVPETPERHAFILATEEERKKIISKLLDRAKSDKDEEKQAARAEAIRIIEDLTRTVHAQGGDPTLLAELDRFLPMLHERAAPLKLIFEHLLLVLPKNLVR